ncbi:MAG: DUF2309 domain-containing protein [Planctomycetales bacterium]|nr:DUF2309 domain-containing protein [Planctomycetales bacterium]
MQPDTADRSASSQGPAASNGSAESNDSADVNAAYARINDIVRQAGELLPAQGPITAFVFLNTLQALEDLPFDEGLKRGARLFGCRPYLAEEQYREKLQRGRIRRSDLAACLQDDLGTAGDEKPCDCCTRFDLRLAMLEFPLRTGPAEELRWFVAETDALSRMRPDVSQEARERFVEETKHWVMRDLRSNHKTGLETPGERVGEKWLEQVAAADLERYDAKQWEAAALQLAWRICRHGVIGLATNAAPLFHATRHRDYLLEACGVDSDLLVHELLIRFCAAFVDQGFADWSLPARNQGFFKAFCTVYGGRGGPPEPWQAGLAEELARLDHEDVGPRESIVESLRQLGVSEGEWDEFLTESLVALRGWAGLLRQNEVRSDRVAVPVPQGTLLEFLAVRLVLERFALRHVAKTSLGFTGPLFELRETALASMHRVGRDDDDQRAFQVFQLAQVLGWTPAQLAKLSRQCWGMLTGEIEAFNGLERRRILHQAFERRFRNQVLDAFTLHTRSEPRTVDNPKFQSVYCIDAREESFRRHLEEIEPEAETFGAPGFFGVAMYYRGASDAHYSTLCPIVVMPQHWVTEEVVYSLEETHKRRARTRKALGAASLQVHSGSRSLAKGALLTAGLGVLASIPLVARVLFPRLTARIRRRASSIMETPVVTRLVLERHQDPPGLEPDHAGFNLTEMTDRAERLLRDIGLTSNFARLVFFFGHGSFCLNNPHKSAYDCGACSGAAGAPNARALAAMLNDRRVRDRLAQRGLNVPDTTIFVGGLHNTCADAITFFDLDLLPRSHRNDFESAVNTLERVCERNAHERCRRFDSAPLNISYQGARRHVENRSEDLAQTRPEFGNATNAICYVGRRSRNRGLYLDRRCFMNSYDPTQDDEQCSILARILAAAVPVCEGINLQYFFSYIDSPGWGAGTKLPHNVTSLLGVMDGAASDLRTGLPWQGVEIHEPVRLLFVLETTPAGILGIMDRNPVIGRILRNGWAQLALLDPHSSKVLHYHRGEFVEHVPEKQELPRAATSTDWYRGWRDHLEFAVIEP